MLQDLGNCVREEKSASARIMLIIKANAYY
jgi:hypothetical protein